MQPPEPLVESVLSLNSDRYHFGILTESAVAIAVQTGQSWEWVREELEEIFLVDLQSPEGAFQVCTQLTDQQRNIMRLLKISEPKQVRSASVTSADM